jgi:AmmeMemoRadiSam system protein A
LYTTLYACKKLGGDKVEILKYANSGDTPYGEKDRVVGYCAVGIFRSKDIGREGETSMKDRGANVEEEKFYLPEEVQKELLRIARESISTALDGKEVSYEPKYEELNRSAAVFVTLRKRGQLRGCIGTTVPQEPLYKAVIHMAREAAFSDPRFPPVGKSELKDIEIEISVLSPLKLVSSADEIIPKVHGVYIRQGFRGGLYLPQVWEETGWTKEEFLNSLCAHKAGLPENAWKSKNTQIYVFTVFSFEEKK